MDSLAKRRRKHDGPMGASGYSRKSRSSTARPRGERTGKLRAGEKMGYEEGRLAVLRAFKREIQRNNRLLERLKSLDHEIVARALYCCDSPAGAASFLTQEHPLLNGSIPVEMPRTAATKRELMELLHRIDFGIAT